MSGRSDLTESVKEWNINNHSFHMFLDHENGSPRNYIRIKVKSIKSDKIVLELTGREGEEFLWAEIIERLNIYEQNSN